MLTYIKFSHRNSQSKTYNLYSCHCGKEKIIREDIVKTNDKKRKVISCGCAKKDIVHLTGTHKMTKTRPYRIWSGIKTRCNTNSYQYKYYYGKGIKICKRWNRFENFWEDMKDTYKDNLSIDRIDNNKGYCKNNCRWSDSFIQNSNKSNNKFVNDGNETLNIMAMARKHKIKPSTLYMRLNSYGWNILKAINKINKK